MAARKRPNNTTPNYIVTMDNENFEKESSLFIGKLRSNFMGTEFQIYDTGMNPSDTKNFDNVRAHLGCIKYVSIYMITRKQISLKKKTENLDFDYSDYENYTSGITTSVYEIQMTFKFLHKDQLVQCS